MTSHEARQEAEKARSEPRRKGRRPRGRTRAQGAPWSCPRCRSTGDPRACTCMRQLRRRLDDARRELRLGRPGRALTELACASELLDLLTKDAIKAAGGRTGG